MTLRDINLGGKHVHITIFKICVAASEIALRAVSKNNFTKARTETHRGKMCA